MIIETTPTNSTTSRETQPTKRSETSLRSGYQKRRCPNSKPNLNDLACLGSNETGAGGDETSKTEMTNDERVTFHLLRAFRSYSR